MNHNLKLLATVSTLAFAIPATPSFAQSAAESDQGSGLEEIIVTARRVEENQQRVPVAVTSLGSAALEKRQITETGDLQFSVPSLQVKPNMSAPSIPQFQLRGQRQNGFTDANVVTYVDGVAQGVRSLGFYDLESVQALKGPQGTLFGRNSDGGAVVFTTRKPTFDFGGQLSADIGNYDLTSMTGAINLPIVDGKVALRVAGKVERRDGVFKNVLAGEDDLGDRHNQSGRISLLLKPNDRLESVFMADGTWRREIPNPPIIEAALNPATASGFAGLISLLTSQAVQQQSLAGGGVAFVSSDGLTIQRGGSPFAIAAVTGVGRTVPAGGHFQALGGIGSKTEAYGFQNTTSYELSDSITLRNIMGYRYDKSRDDSNPEGMAGYDLDLGPFLAALGGGNPATAPQFLGRVINNNTPQQQLNKAFSEEFQVIGKTESLNFILGAFYGHSNERYSNITEFAVGPVDFYGGFGPKAQQITIITDSYALFGQGTYDFSSMGLEGVRFTGGLRYTWDKRDMSHLNSLSVGNNTIPPVYQPGYICNAINGTGASATGVNTATECNIFGSRTYKALSWTASLEYQANKDTLIYLASRRGFKSGGIAPTRNLDLAIFDKEQLTDFELGIKHQGYLGSAPYRLNLAGYVGKYKDIQTQDVLTFCLDPNNCGAGTYTELLVFNVGKATMAGIEVEGSIVPFHDFTLDFAYNYQHSKYGAGSNIPQPLGNGPISATNPIDYVNGAPLKGSFAGLPKHQFSVSGTYRASFVPESFAKVSLSANYAYLSSQIGRTVEGIAPIPGFGVTNAKLSFDSLFESQASVSFWAKNLFDKAYRTRCTNNLNSIGYSSCIWGDPRTYGINLSVDF